MPENETDSNQTPVPNQGAEPTPADAAANDAGAAASARGEAAGEAPASPPLKPAAQAALEADGPNWLVALREGTTTLIALVILGITIVMLWMTFQKGGTFENQKDILLYALPLLGTILGYYFGRVPAERRAEVSEKNADEAQQTAQSATQHAAQTQQKAGETLNRVKVGIERAKAKLESGAAAGPAGGDRGGSRGGVLGGGGGPQTASVGAASPARGDSGATDALAELDAVSKIL